MVVLNGRAVPQPVAEAFAAVGPSTSSLIKTELEDPEALVGLGLGRIGLRVKGTS